MIVLVAVAALALAGEPALAPARAAADVVDVAVFDGVLAAAVKGDRVDYAAVAAARPALQRFLDAVGAAVVGPAASAAAKGAFYVDAYNALVLAAVVDAGLHTKAGARVVDVKGFFDAATFVVAGERLTLNALEAKARALDPRVHFVVNCASRDCPPLAPRAYRAATWEADLAQQTRAFLAQPAQLTVTSTEIVTSQIFEWYAADFGGAAGVRAFLTRWGPASTTTIAAQPLRHRSYDWTLNAAPAR